MTEIRNKELERLSAFLDHMDEYTLIEKELLDLMSRDSGILVDVRYDPYNKCCWGEYIKIGEE